MSNGANNCRLATNVSDVGGGLDNSSTWLANEGLLNVAVAVAVVALAAAALAYDTVMVGLYALHPSSHSTFQSEKKKIEMPQEEEEQRNNCFFFHFDFNNAAIFRASSSICRGTTAYVQMVL